jgi:hypothetical protein
MHRRLKRRAKDWVTAIFIQRNYRGARGRTKWRVVEQATVRVFSFHLYYDCINQGHVCYIIYEVMMTINSMIYIFILSYD